MSNDYWRTPARVMVPMAAMSPRVGISLDPFSARKGKPTNVVAQHYLYEDKRKPMGGGGLIADWRELAGDGLTFAQPPYGREKLGTCMEKIRREGFENKVWTLALVPASTDVGWFHDQWECAAQVCFWKGRIKFVSPGKTNSALFPNVVFHYPGRVHQLARQKRFERIFSQKGIVVPCRQLAFAGVGALPMRPVDATRKAEQARAYFGLDGEAA